METAHQQPGAGARAHLPALLPAMLVVAVLTGTTLAPVLTADFLNWDELSYVVSNRAVAEFDVGALVTRTYVGNYHPLTMLSHAMDRRVWGLDPRAHHLANLLLHVVATIAVLLLAHELLGGRLVPALVALLWAVHPLKVEPVAWVAQRKEVLCGLLYLVSLWTYVRYVKSGHKGWFAGATASFVLALLAKPTAVTVPVVWVLLDDFLRRGVDRRTLLEKAPHFALSVAAGAVALATQHAAGAVRWSAAGPVGLHLAFQNVVFYLEKFLVPTHLSAMYPWTMYLGLTLAETVLSLLVVVAVVSLAILGRRWDRMWALGLGVFLVAIAPVAGLVPLGKTVAADRYMYIPMLGLVLLLGQGLTWMAGRSAWVRNTALAGILVAIVGCAWSSHQRAQVWQDSPRLWQSVLADFPNCAVAWNNLGDWHAHVGDPEAGAECFRKAIRAQADYPHAHFNLASVLARLGHRADAAQHLRQARRLWRNHPPLQRHVDAQLAALDRTTPSDAHAPAGPRPGRRQDTPRADP